MCSSNENNKIKINRTTDRRHKLISSVFVLVSTKIASSLFHVLRPSDIKEELQFLTAPSMRDESAVLSPKRKGVYDLCPSEN